MANNEQVLLDALKQYEEGLYSSIQQTLATGKMDPLSAGVAQEVSTNIPGASQLAQAAGQVIKTIGSIAGAGPFSAVTRAGNDLASMNLGGLYKDLFGGRTFNTDQYWGAVYFYRYVLGKDVNNQNQIGDADVLNGLKWFEDKTGVFISGREHIEALQKSAQDYMNLYGVNSYTTTDITRVNNAVGVMKRYMPNPGFSQPIGIWANAVGVYDAALAGMVAGSSSWQSAINGLKQGYQATDTIPGSSSSGILTGTNFSFDLSSPYVKLAALLIIVLILVLVL